MRLPLAPETVYLAMESERFFCFILALCSHVATDTTVWFCWMKPASVNVAAALTRPQFAKRPRSFEVPCRAR